MIKFKKRLDILSIILIAISFILMLFYSISGGECNNEKNNEKTNNQKIK